MNERAFAPLSPVLALVLGASACSSDGDGVAPSETEDGTSTALGDTTDASPQETTAETGEVSGESGDPDSGAGIEAARTLFEPLVRAQCAQMFGCCNVDELAYRLGAVDSVDACTQAALDVMEAGYAPSFGLTPLYLSNYLIFFAYGLDPDRTQVNDDAFGACEDAIASAACPSATGPGSSCVDQEYTQPQACDVDELFTGMQAAGDDCTLQYSVECAPGLTCQVVGAEGGFCVEALGVGDPCFNDYNCGGELICDYGTATCTQPGERGDACAYPEPLDPHPGLETPRCALGLSCDPVSESCQSSQCGFGSYCDNDDDVCPDGLVCVAGECDFLAQPGEACWYDDDCDAGSCQHTDEGAFCFALGNTGDACTTSDQCSTGYCNPTQAECDAPIAAGDPCDPFGSDGQCEDGYCDGANCVAFGDVGDACPPATCNWLEQASCVDGECVAYPYPNGVPCTWDGECSSGHCLGDCSPPLGIGDTCVLGSTGCGDAAYCDGDGSSTEGTCEEKRSQAEACTSSVQCWSSCNAVFGELRCSGTAPGEAACDGD